jgi:hypothetical protein
MKKKVPAKKVSTRPAKGAARTTSTMPAVVGEKKTVPILEVFEKVYELFLVEQRAKVEDLKQQFKEEPGSAEYFEAEFKANFLEVESIERLYSYWLNYGVLPKSKIGCKNIQGRLAQSQAYAKERRVAWNSYAPWLDSYFKRNPAHSLSNGRKACAGHFKISPKTVERRTKKYCKPL